MTSATRHSRAVDRLGGFLLALYLGAIWLATRQGGAPAPMVELLLATTAALIAGRSLGRVHRMIVPGVVVAAAIGLWAEAAPVIGGGPLEGPFGYRNATGAFFVQAVVGALMIAVLTRWTPLRALAILVALAFAAVAAADSMAAAASLVVIVVAVIGLGGAKAVRVFIGIAAAIFVLTLLGVVALGAGYRPGGDGAVSRALTQRRLVLWHESLQIIAADPAGAGPGRFADVDPSALHDGDAHWAHDEFLQQGVELGWAGLALCFLVFAWGFARLWVSPSPDTLVALGAASLAALGIHASLDYVLHFPAVPLTAAALVGTAQAVPRRRSLSDGHEYRQEGVEGGRHAVRAAGSAPPR